MAESTAERRLHASMAADHSWARMPGREARTARAMPGVNARLAKLADEADPDGLMTDEERAEAARLLMRAYMKNLRRKQMRNAA